MLSDAEVFKKCVDRAIGNGFNWWMVNNKDKVLYPRGDIQTNMLFRTVVVDTIFDHSFCKALFGKQLLCYDCGEKVGPPMMVGKNIQIGTGECSCSRQFENNEEAWEYHIQQLALAEDRIEYLRKYLEENK